MVKVFTKLLAGICYYDHLDALGGSPTKTVKTDIRKVTSANTIGDPLPKQPYFPVQPSVPPSGPLPSSGPVQPSVPLPPHGPVQAPGPWQASGPWQAYGPLQPSGPWQASVPWQPSGSENPSWPLHPLVPEEPAKKDEQLENTKSESFYRSILQACLWMAGARVTPEKLENLGRLDLEVVFGNLTYVIEIKMTKNSRGAAQTVRAGMKQINARGYGRASDRPILVSLAIGREERNIVGCLFERDGQVTKVRVEK
ncbi:MAG: PD-(D/E)XK nuclease domain-containing protein [Deltaproteobacteria bacterium]|nr:PD-(D/E)XK nuclease domain-containing protein [Deltaproteobacteria bacterium]